MPQLWVVAGPNGAGKTTLADAWLADRLEVVSPDSIARQRSVSALQAGRLAMQWQRTLLAAGADFAVETTLAGHHELALMREAAALGYKISLVFIGVEGVFLCRSRITERVTRGGHTVPDADVVRRYARSLANLPPATELAHRVYVLDNSKRNHRLLLSVEAGRVKHRSERMPAWAATALAGHPGLAGRPVGPG